MMAGLITNGYFLVPKRIEELNDAGLDFLQISIDNVEPDEVSKKSLRRARQEAAAPARSTPTFDVNINSVLGGGIKNPEDARTINSRARELGFSTSIGIIHDGSGRLKPLGAGRAQGVRRRLGGDQRPVAGVQEPLLGNPQLPGQPRRRQAERVALPRGRALPLHLRGRPRPLLLAAARLSRRAARALHDRRHPPRVRTPKSCAPYCTVGCVHRVSTMDFWRTPAGQPWSVAVTSAARGFSRRSTRSRSRDRSIRRLLDVNVPEPACLRDAVANVLPPGEPHSHASVDEARRARSSTGASARTTPCRTGSARRRTPRGSARRRATPSGRRRRIPADPGSVDAVVARLGQRRRRHRTRTF